MISIYRLFARISYLGVPDHMEPLFRERLRLFNTFLSIGIVFTLIQLLNWQFISPSMTIAVVGYLLVQLACLYLMHSGQYTLARMSNIVCQALVVWLANGLGGGIVYTIAVSASTLLSNVLIWDLATERRQLFFGIGITILPVLLGTELSLPQEEFYRYIPQPQLFWPRLLLTLSALFCLVMQGYNTVTRHQKLFSFQQRALEQSRRLTNELAEAVKEIQLVHLQLLESEKKAALGQLAANIAHELNSPLGAIRASAEELKSETSKLIDVWTGVWAQLPAEERLALAQHKKRLQTQLPHAHAREVRQHRRNLTNELYDFDVKEPETWAERLAHAGYTHIDSSLAKVLRKSEADRCLEAVARLAEWYMGLNTITAATRRTTKAVKGFQGLVQAEEWGKTELLQLQQCLQQVLDEQRSVLQEAEVLTDIETRLAWYGVADDIHLLLTHLVHNAAMALNTRGRIEIHLRAASDGALHIRVEDDGPGIRPEVLPRVFEAFYSDRPLGEGSGLGLYLCERIAIRYGGNIEVHSRPGQTCFTVVLPPAPDKVLPAA